MKNTENIYIQYLETIAKITVRGKHTFVLDRTDFASSNPDNK